MILPQSLNNASGGTGFGDPPPAIGIFSGALATPKKLTGNVKNVVDGNQVTSGSITGSVTVVKSDGSISQVVEGNIVS